LAVCFITRVAGVSSVPTPPSNKQSNKQAIGSQSSLAWTLSCQMLPQLLSAFCFMFWVDAKGSFIQKVIEDNRLPSSTLFETCKAKGECFRYLIYHAHDVSFFLSYIVVYLYVFVFMKLDVP
jgi:hypothetical protein